MKIYKKILCLIVVSLGLNGTALAAGSIAPAKPYFDSFYMGLGAAVGLTTPKLSSDSTITVWNDTTKTSPPLAEITGSYDQGNSSKYSGSVPVFLGYGKTFANRYYAGFELGANYFFDSKMHDTDTYSVTPIKEGVSHNPQEAYDIKNPVSLNAIVRLGYVSPYRFMLYVLAGLDYSYFKVTNTMSDHYKDANIDNNFSITDKFNKWLPGLLTGIGGETAINDHLSLRLQYTFSFFDSYKHDAEEHGTVSDINNKELLHPYDINMRTKLNPNRGTLQLMLSYLFN